MRKKFLPVINQPPKKGRTLITCRPFSKNAVRIVQKLQFLNNFLINQQFCRLKAEKLQDLADFIPRQPTGLSNKSVLRNIRDCGKTFFQFRVGRDMVGHGFVVVGRIRAKVKITGSA